MSFQNVADATVMVSCGESRGSGFHFRTEDQILTNAHVVDGAISGHEGIYLQNESGNEIRATLVDHSPENVFDYAILETQDRFSEERETLEPSSEPAQRGQEIQFGGFPHGIDDLLVHEASVSGPCEEHSFYVDGSVNGGNSGGPIIDPNSDEVVGIVTQRRFLGESSMTQAERELSRIKRHFDQMGGSAGVAISGIDFGEFARLLSDSFEVISNVVSANANTGIGIGFHIEHADQAVDGLE